MKKFYTHICKNFSFTEKLISLTLITMEPQPGDFPFQFTNLLFLLIPITKAIVDVFFTEFKSKPVLHKKSLTLFITIGAAVALLDFKISPVPTYVQSVFLGITTFWLVFDYLRNKFAGKDFFYMDLDPQSDDVEDSWVDSKIYSKLPNPLAWLLIKLWFFGTSIALYYYSSYLNFE
jgi:hypothetical protein